VELRLSVGVGSVAETDAQQGLAHLVEHLEFEGTDRFGPQDIISFLESNGMKFGNELNAFTSFNETQYFLNLPADKPESLKTGLLVLEDWAHGPKVTPEYLEKEKKIVAEESRLSQESLQGRIQQPILAAIMHGTKYPERFPIGKMEILSKVGVQDVNSFVSAWYRPERMAITIVGDVDPTAMETALKASFSKSFPPKPALKPLGAEKVAPYSQDASVVIKDKEESYTIYQPLNIINVNKADYAAFDRTLKIAAVCSDALNKRFSALSLQDKSPILQAGCGASNIVGNNVMVYFAVVPREGKDAEAVEALFTEMRRASQNGLTAQEFRTGLEAQKSAMEAFKTQMANIENSQRSTEISAYALYGDAAPSLDYRYEQGKKNLDALTIKDVNDALAGWALISPTLVLSLSKEQPKSSVLGEADIAAIKAKVKAVDSAQITQAKDLVRKDLIRTPPQPGKIVAEQKIEGTPFVKWTLSNGIAVYLYKNDKTKNDFILRGFSMGGLNLVPDEDYLSAMVGPVMFSQTGLGGLDNNQLQDFLSGMKASVFVNAEELMASVYGVSDPADPVDMLKFFQVLNQKLSGVERRPGVENAYLDQLKTVLVAQQDLPNRLYQNEIERLACNGVERYRPIRADRVSEIDPDRSAFYMDQFFKNAGGFTFVISGDYDEVQLRDLVKTYLASLPEIDGTQMKDLGKRPSKGPVTSVVKAGHDNKAVITINYDVPMKYNPYVWHKLTVLREVLNIRLREVLRQEKEGTYNVSVDTNASPNPYAQAMCTINFTCALERQDELLSALMAEIDAITKGNIPEETLKKAKEIRRQGRTDDERTNSTWNQMIYWALINGDSLSGIMGFPEYYAKVTKDDVVKLARSLLDRNNALTVILNPEK
jgi:zinc protease